MSTQPKYYGPGEAPKHAQYSVKDFAARIKARQPSYADMDDQELVSRVIKKHPQYQTSLTTEALQERAAELPTREETERAYTAAGPQIKPARKGLVPWLERTYGKMMHEGIPSWRPSFLGGLPVTPKMPALTAGAGGGAKPPGQPSVAEVIAGPALGPVRAATGLARIFTQPTPEPGFAGGARGLTEIIGGAMQVAPLPAMRATRGALPAFIPPFEAAMEATRRAVEPLPISPETKELAATVIPLAGGAAIAGAPAVMRRGRAARARVTPPVPAPTLRLPAAPVRRALPPPRGPEVGIERELPGGVMRPVPEARVPPVAERAPQAKPAPPVKPLPPPQLIAPREAAELGVRPERVPEVLRRQREGEAAQQIAAERPVERPSMLEREPSAPAKSLDAARTGKPVEMKLLMGSGRKEMGSVYSQGYPSEPILGPGRYSTPSREFAEFFGPTVEKVAVRLENPLTIRTDAEWGTLTRRAGWKFPNPIRMKAEGLIETSREIAQLRKLLESEGYDGVIIRLSRIGDEAKTLGRVFGDDTVVEFSRKTPTAAPAPFRTKPLEAGTKVYDKFGDELQAGRYATDPLGKRLKIEGFVETPEGATHAVVKRGKVREEINAENLMVRVKPRKKGYAPSVRQFGESEEAFGARVSQERGFLRAEDVLPIEAIRDFVAGVKEIGKGITARFKGRAVRAPSKKPAQDLADQIDVVATKLTRDAEMLLEQTENIAATGTFQPGPPGRGARAERAARAPVRPQLRVSEQMVKELNAQIVATARAVKELRSQAETTGSAGLNKTLRAAEAHLEVLAGRYRPLPKAAGRAVKAFDYPVPQEVIAELQRVGLFLKHASKPGLSDYIFEAWVNFLLSGPKTHLVNSVSNTLVRLSGTAERAAGATLDLARAKVTGTPRERFFGEVAQEAFGLWRGIKEGARIGLEAWRTEAPVTSKLEIARERAIPGRVGRVIRTPGRALIAADEFFKAINRRVEINALAYRTAAQEGKIGVARAERIARLIDKPTPEMLQAAEVEMLYRTFQQPFGPWSQHIASMRSIIPGMRYIVPFLRTPINIAKFSLERTPLNFIRLAQMFAKGELKGAGLSTEVAKPIVGTVIGAAVVMLAVEGKITGGGPRDRGKRRVLYDTGWQPYSFKVGDTYYSYNRFEPVGALFGMAADYVEIFDEVDELEQSQIIGRMVLSISRNITSKTYMRGISDAMNAVSDPERYSSTWLESIAGTVIPTVVAELSRATDPFYREPTTALEAIKARIPGLSRQIQPKRGVFGQPALRQGGFARRFFLPPIAAPMGGAPEREMARLKMGVAAPSKKIGIRGRELELTPEEYGRYQETGGGLARTAMERLIGRAAYQRMSDEERERVIRSLTTRARGAARGRMIRSIPRPQLLQRYAEARR